MIAIICAICSGVTIVLSRSVNGLLANEIGASQSTFVNYFTGLLMSCVFLLLIGIKDLQTVDFNIVMKNPVMLIGGMIGVVNIFILNIVVMKISPVKLTLFTFVSQLLSGIVLDYVFFGIFSTMKLIGCCLVVIGLYSYQTFD